MAHVHPECLAEWRRTAANSRAFYSCEQCGTEYRIRQNALALALMSRNFIVGLTVVICVALTTSVGIVVDALPLPKTSTECAHALYRLIAYAPPWYTSTRVSLPWRERCDVFVLGACAVATVGFAFFIRAEWLRHREGGAEGMRHMALFVAWLTSLQGAQSSRFGVAFGLLFAYSTVFAETRVHAKFLSQKIGETILAYRPAAAAAGAAADRGDGASDGDAR